MFSNDVRYALAIGLLSTTLLWDNVRFAALETLAHPIPLLLAIIAILFALTEGYRIVAVVLIGVLLYLGSEWSTYTSTPQRRLYVDKLTGDARFEPSLSVDIQVADRHILHHSPEMLDQTKDVSPLLTYPPSGETLRELSG
jgi:hypothetical protein